MLDFDRLNRQLDLAAHVVGNIQKLYEEARAEIDAAPADQRQELEVRFLSFCNCRAEFAKQLLDAHLDAFKRASN
jgi:hypothetical protein